MILKYDSILGIPVIKSGETYNESSNGDQMFNGLNLGVPSILIFVAILVLFVVLFSSLGKTESNDISTTNEGGNG